mmetsp:Transcript_152869/g.267125  ORF Transcript_152869/g.267125 Transcript_152869/m.267125 type:complete len:406 (-) Transcript_152869:546-1763(-)
MGLKGWLLLDGRVGQHILSESYSPAFGLPLGEGDQTALAMSLAALVFALQQNADCVLPRLERPPEETRLAEYQRLSADPQWVDRTPNASGIHSHTSNGVLMSFFQHLWFDILCVVVQDSALPPELGDCMAELVCKRFIRLQHGVVADLALGSSHKLAKTFRPVLHSILRTVTCRFCCARALDSLWALFKSTWILITYSPELTAQINRQLPPQPVPKRRTWAFWKHRRASTPALELGESPVQVPLRGCSLLYLKDEDKQPPEDEGGEVVFDDDDAMEPSDVLDEGPEETLRLQTLLANNFCCADESAAIASVLDTVLALGMAQRAFQGGEESLPDVVMECQMDGRDGKSIRLKVVKHGHLYCTFPAGGQGPDPPLVRQLLAEDLANAHALFQLLHTQKVPVFMDME